MTKTIIDEHIEFYRDEVERAMQQTREAVPACESYESACVFAAQAVVNSLVTYRSKLLTASKWRCANTPAGGIEGDNGEG